MQQVLFATSNKSRFEFIQEILRDFPFKLISPRDMKLKEKIEEKGRNPLENSKLKASAFFRLSQIPTFAIDSGLYIDKFPEEDQPGTCVRRINGARKEADDTAMLLYYKKRLEKAGGSSPGRWENGLTLVLPDRGTFSTLFSRSTFFTSQESPKRSPGEPLNALQLDPETGKYLSELTPGELEKIQVKTREHILKFFVSHFNL